MNLTSRWMIRYCTLALVPLLAGPVLGAWPAAQAVPAVLFDVTGAPALRLSVEGLGLAAWWVCALLAALKMPDNLRGSTFLRNILVPLTTVLVLILGDNSLRSLGPSLIDRVGAQHYAAGHAAGLVASGLWLTIAWWLSREPLRRVFAGRPSEAPPASPAAGPENPGASDGPTVDAGDGGAATPALGTNGGPRATLGRYRILKELGRGAMGIVYLGKDPTIQRFVAIKTMSLNAADDAESLRDVKARFFREAESTGRLSHPNIVTIYDAGEEEDLVYLAMEMLEGSTLKYWSRQPNLMPLDRLIPIIADVADALDFAHQQGVIHRDIKPANIMVTNANSVKVMDFGVAKMTSSTKTHPQVVLGTPTYMSPEQLSGKKVDGRSDIFSLGVVLYELFAGRPPFAADNVTALLYAIAQAPHPPLATLKPNLPPALCAVVDRALEKDAAQRYRRAGDMAEALRACRQDLAA